MLLLRPPADLDDWLSAGIAARFDGAADAFSAVHFPALLAGSIVVVTEGAFGIAAGAGFHRLPAACVGGPSPLPRVLQHTARLRYVGVMVRPAAMAAVLGGLPGALCGSIAAARDVFGPEGRYLPEALAPLADAAAIDALFGFVRLRVRRTGDARLRAAQHLQAANGRDLAEAARGHGCSTRQLERRFVAAFGVGPKRFQRLARTEMAMRHVLAGGRCDADFALRMGCYDQSHLGRDLRELAGLPPATLAQAACGDDPSLWALRAGAAYARAGIRADFAAA